MKYTYGSADSSGLPIQQFEEFDPKNLTEEKRAWLILNRVKEGFSVPLAEKVLDTYVQSQQ